MNRSVTLRIGRSFATSAALLAVIGALAVLYTSTGGASRHSLVDEMLVNLMLVMGMQIFVGNTGVLSFGHLAFAQIAGYTAAIVALPLASKAKIWSAGRPELPRSGPLPASSRSCRLP